MNRANRRRKDALVKKKRKKYWGGWKQDDPVATGKKASAPKPISTCACCINRRVIDGETRQELKHPIEEQEDD